MSSFRSEYEQFHFSNSGSSEGVNDAAIRDSVNDIHPMELVVQSLLGEPLDALSNHLQHLHESQVVLIARVKIIDEKLKKYKRMHVDVDMKDTSERLFSMKRRLQAILATLKRVEARVVRIQNSI